MTRSPLLQRSALPKATAGHASVPAEESITGCETDLPAWSAITVVINRRSGHNDTTSARAAIEEALRLAGRPYEVTVVAAGDAAMRAARSAVRRAAGAPATVIAAGGDGTLNAVAQVLAGTNVALGVVPLGAFNYLARNLGIPSNPARRRGRS